MQLQKGVFPEYRSPEASRPRSSACWLLLQATKRLRAWMASVVEALMELNERSADLMSSLRDNDLFITAVLQATQVAVRTHQLQKLEALRNIVLNTARPVTLDEDIALLCIRLVEYLTPTRVVALRELECNAERVSVLMKSGDGSAVEGFLRASIPALAAHPSFSAQVYRDLVYQGLFWEGITVLGQDFLSVIRSGPRHESA